MSGGRAPMDRKLWPREKAPKAAAAAACWWCSSAPERWRPSGNKNPVAAVPNEAALAALKDRSPACCPPATLPPWEEEDWATESATSRRACGVSRNCAPRGTAPRSSRASISALRLRLGYTRFVGSGTPCRGDRALRESQASIANRSYV